MRSTVFKVCALAVALAVLTFIVVQSSRPRGATAIEAEPTAAPSASASAGAKGDDEEAKGVMGPATKADSHAVRRAVKSLEGK